MATVLKQINSLVTERLKLNRWFRANAAAKNGVPWTEGDDVATVEHQHYHHGLEPPPQAPVPSPEPPPASVPPGDEPTQEAPPGRREWIAWALVVVLGLLTSGGFGWWWGGTSEEPPAEPPASSLFQDLEDRGFHLPPTE